jgi:hypothetical protein
MSVFNMNRLVLVAVYFKKPFVVGIITLPNKNSATFRITKYVYCAINHRGTQRPQYNTTI